MIDVLEYKTFKYVDNEKLRATIESLTLNRNLI